jgi:hypothetical protein
MKMTKTHSTSRGADEHILAGFVGNWIYKTLHAVERLVALEGPFAKTIHFRDLHKLSTSSKRP